MSTAQELSIGEWLNSLHPVYNKYKKKFDDVGISTMKDFFDLSTVNDDVERFFKHLGITNPLHENRLKREIKEFIESKKVIAKIERKEPERKEPASDSDDDDDFGDWDNIDDGFSRKVVTRLCKDKNAVVLSKSSSSSTTANTAASTLGGALSAIPAAVNTTQAVTRAVTKDVTTTTMKTTMGFIHHHYYTISQIPVTTTQTVTEVVPLAKSAIIGNAAIGAGIASAAMFSAKLGWDLIQYVRGNISKTELKQRTIQSFITNGTVCASSIAGSAIGTAYLPGIGTIVGSIVGSLVGAFISWKANKKLDKHWNKKSEQKFPDVKMDIPDDPKKIVTEAAKFFGFSEEDLNDTQIFNIVTVKRRYKRNAKEHHPDHHGSHKQFIKFHANYMILINHLKKQ